MPTSKPMTPPRGSAFCTVAASRAATDGVSVTRLRSTITRAPSWRTRLDVWVNQPGVTPNSHFGSPLPGGSRKVASAEFRQSAGSFHPHGRSRARGPWRTASGGVRIAAAPSIRSISPGCDGGTAAVPVFESICTTAGTRIPRADRSDSNLYSAPTFTPTVCAAAPSRGHRAEHGDWRQRYDDGHEKVRLCPPGGASSLPHQAEAEAKLPSKAIGLPCSATKPVGRGRATDL